MKTSNVIHTTLADVLFEDRNKAYGSYQIRQKDGQTTMLALGLTTITAVALLLLFRFLQPAVQAIQETGVITLTEITLPDNTFKVPEPETALKASEPAAASQPKGMDTQASGTPTPVPDNPSNLATSIPADSAYTDKQPGLANTAAGSTTGTGGSPTGCMDCPPANGTGTSTADAPSPYEVFLGEMPTPLNMGEVVKKVGYPASLRDMRLEGKASYRVLVDEEGRYVRHELIRASHPLFDKQCAPQLSALRFTPGKMGKHPVKVWITVPFRFELKK